MGEVRREQMAAFRSILSSCGSPLAPRGRPAPCLVLPPEPRGGTSECLLRTIARIRPPRDEFLGDRSPSWTPETLSIWVVDTCPNPWKSPALFPTARTACAMRRKQISGALGWGGGKCRVIRRIARKIGRGERRHDCRIELGRPDIPIGELAILARDGSIERRGSCDQSISSSHSWRVLVNLVFENPLIHVNIPARCSGPPDSAST